jgi:hypothetical protein
MHVNNIYTCQISFKVVTVVGDGITHDLSRPAKMFLVYLDKHVLHPNLIHLRNRSTLCFTELALDFPARLFCFLKV